MAENVESKMEEDPPTPITINDVPPEVLEIIVKKLDSGKNSMLPYRGVNSTWKSIIDEHLEKRNLKGDLVGCSKALIVPGKKGDYLVPKIFVPEKIFNHPGNPFPSRSLWVDLHADDNYQIRNKRKCIISLDTFTTKFGSYLTTFKIDYASLEYPGLIQILKPLYNLRTLKLHSIIIIPNSEHNIQPIPTLPHLTTLELYMKYVSGGRKNDGDHFCQNFVTTYAEQLTSLELLVRCGHSEKLPLHDFYTYHGAFPNLQQLKIYRPNKNFLRITQLPKLKHLSVIGVWSIKKPDFVDKVNVDVLMGFVDEFRNTLESLELDVLWNQMFDDTCKQEAARTGGILQTATETLSKLKKLTLCYPSTEMEEALIRKTFLVKFPALQVLHLLCFKHVHKVYYDDSQRNNDIIMDFINRQNYQNVCPTLKSISVWSVGDTTEDDCFDNELLFSYQVSPIQIRK